MSFAEPARYTATATRDHTGTGSHTQTLTSTPTPGSAAVTDDEGHSDVVGVLKLRGERTGRKVQWENDTVDNEGLGRKKSKICCIYHKPRAFDESSSSSSSSCSSSDDENAQPTNPPQIPHLPHNPSSDGEGPNRKGKSKAKDQNGAAMDADGFPIVRKNRESSRNGTGSQSSDSSESDGGLGDGSARPLRQKRRHHLAHNHAHPWTSDCEADADHHHHHHHHRRQSNPQPADDELAEDPSKEGKMASPRRKSKAKPNKYEVQPGGE